jgi:hypothetical protein
VKSNGTDDTSSLSHHILFLIQSLPGICVSLSLERAI